jgi:hypothetical protein
VETTAEDIKFLIDFQGTPAGIPEAVFAFYSPLEILLLGLGVVKWVEKIKLFIAVLAKKCCRVR